VKKKLDEMEQKNKATIAKPTENKQVGISLPRGFVTLSKEQQRLLEILKNPIVKITDFDLLIHKDEEKHTRQMRFFRSPEIVLGLDYDKGIDYWAFGHLVMEMVTDSWLIDVKMDSKYKILDDDLITIKLFFEKMCCNKRDADDLMDLILSSKRKNYLIDEERGILKFVDEIRHIPWTNRVSDTKIRELLCGLFKINHVERVMEWRA
jgi:serine/threonine protein kinase